MTSGVAAAPEGGSRDLLDTSVFIARESRRPLDVAVLPDEGYVSVITSAELQAGVLAATDQTPRSRRPTTLTRISTLVALPVDAAAAAHWARMRVRLAASRSLAHRLVEQRRPAFRYRGCAAVPARRELARPATARPRAMPPLRWQ